jgi:hypothetical protein
MTVDASDATGTNTDVSAAQVALFRSEVAASVASLKSVRKELGEASSDSIMDSVVIACCQLDDIVKDLDSALAALTNDSVANQGATSHAKSKLELRVYPVDTELMSVSRDDDDDIFSSTTTVFQRQLRLLTNCDPSLPTEIIVPLRRARDELLVKLMEEAPKKTMIRGQVSGFSFETTWHGEALEGLQNLSFDGWESELGVSLKVMSLEEAKKLASRNAVASLKSFDLFED